ncbi:hypothetical protein DFP72DRAFT_830458, partial [Ephemerocybe angulata]
PFYGLQGLSHLCYRYLKHLFDCPDSPPNRAQSRVKLLYYIPKLLYSSRFESPVVVLALLLLTRLRERSEATRASGHRLFTTALMVSSSYLCDNTYRASSWRDMSGGLFGIKTLNIMVREMLEWLEWDVSVDSVALERFGQAISVDFARDRPVYPTYPAEMIWTRFSDSGNQHRLVASGIAPTSDANSGTGDPVASFESLDVLDTMLPISNRLRAQLYAFSSPSQY